VAAAVKARIVRIGNSQGIRIPKLVIRQAGLKDTVELEVRKGQLLVRSASRARDGWEDQFRLMAERGDDAPLWDLDGSLSSWDEARSSAARSARPAHASWFRPTRSTAIFVQ
jgi:antitoxin MazE